MNTFRIAVLVCASIMVFVSACAAPAATPTAVPPTRAAQGTGLNITGVWARIVTGMSDAPTDGGGMGTAQPTGAAMGNTPAAMGTMPATMGAMGAVYMNIANGGSTADKLIKAESDVAEAVELHTVIMDNGVMQMRPVEFIEVPAAGSVELKPGGFHVMLIGVKQPLKPGDKFNVKLTFAQAGVQDIVAEVRDQPAQ